MTIGCKTGGPGEGVSYRGSHGKTVRVGRSASCMHPSVQVGFHVLQWFLNIIMTSSVGICGYMVYAVDPWASSVTCTQGTNSLHLHS